MSEPEESEGGSSLIGKKLHYRGIQSRFLTKRKELWFCGNSEILDAQWTRKELWLSANGRFGCAVDLQGIVAMLEWEI